MAGRGALRRNRGAVVLSLVGWDGYALRFSAARVEPALGECPGAGAVSIPRGG